MVPAREFAAGAWAIRLVLLRIFSARKTFGLHQPSCVKLVANETDYVLSGLREVDVLVSLKHRDSRIDRVPQFGILKRDVRMIHPRHRFRWVCEKRESLYLFPLDGWVASTWSVSGAKCRREG